MSATEPRHEENVDNLGILIHNLQTFGSSYQPSNAAFSIVNLTQLKTQGNTAVDAVSAALLLNKNAISSRTYEFSSFDPLITRIANTIKISNAERTIVKRLIKE